MHRPQVRRLPFVFLALCLGLACALPLLLRGPSCGHDFDFHLQSWLAAHAAFHGGVLAPFWVAGANYGAGEPRFVFYPPLSWLGGAALGAVLPWTLVPAAFTVLCLLGAAWSMQRFAARLCSPVSAGLAAALYAASPYLLFTTYERSAYGELLAAAVMPALLDALTRPRLPIAQVATSLAALWYTNAPAGVMGCYLVLLSFAWRLTRSLSRRVQTLLPAAGALLLGCGLAADYLLPAWYEQRFVAIRRAVGPGMRIEDSFFFGHTGEPFHDAVLRSASWIGAATLGAGLLAGAAVLLRRRVASDQARTPIGLCVVLLAAAFLLQLPWSLPVWHALPQLGFLQFPWRLLLPASAAAALLLAHALDGRGTIFKLGVLAAFVGGLVTWAGHTRYQPCDDEDNLPAQVALLASGTGFEGTDEYAPAGTDNGEIQRGLPRVRLLRAPDGDEGDDTAAANPTWKPDPHTAVPGAVEIESWAPERIAVRVRPEADAWAVLGRERWASTPVRLDGKPCGPACVSRDDGLVTVHLPGGRWSELDLSAITPMDVWCGRALTVIALLVLLAAARRERTFMMGRK